MAKLVRGFENQDILTSGGVTLAGARYIYLSGSDRIIRAKLGRNGVHCMKTQQGIYLLPLSSADAPTTQIVNSYFLFACTKKNN